MKYLCDPQTKQERVGEVTVTNCEQREALDAIYEVQAVQGMNLRAEGDKTYHLLISFPPGEHPPRDVLAAVEAELCEALGYGEHQRVSAVHHDTDNLHIHVAINKIHPEHLTMHTPYRDYKTLARKCDELEQRFDLERDNHAARKSRSENRADDMERHSGVESLLGWIKRECLAELRETNNWQELHDVARARGLEVREQGNGLVFESRDGITVKASSVDRSLSRSRLLKQWGDYERPRGTNRRAGEDVSGAAGRSGKVERRGIDRVTIAVPSTSAVAAWRRRAPPVRSVKTRPESPRAIRSGGLPGRHELPAHIPRQAPDPNLISSWRRGRRTVEAVGTRPPPAPYRHRARPSIGNRDLPAQGAETTIGAPASASWRRGKHGTSPTQQRQEWYAKRPVYPSAEADALYRRYREEKADVQRSKQLHTGAARQARIQAIEDAKRSAARLRALIKLLKGSGYNKRFLYGIVSKRLHGAISKAHANFSSQRPPRTSKANKAPAWADWLRDRAEEGDQSALAVLRHQASWAARARARAVERTDSNALRSGEVDSITKAGTVIYRLANAAIRDDGRRLSVTRNAPDEVLATALQLAADRHGGKVSMTGSTEFQQRVVDLAASARIRVSFTDPNLESRRVEALKQKHQQESFDERTRGNRPNGAERSAGINEQRHHERRGSGRSGGDVGRGQYAESVKRGGGRGSDRFVRGRSSPFAPKPNVGAVGRKAPPPQAYRMRNLPTLYMEPHAGSPGLLVPRDVRGGLDNKQADRGSSVRRPASVDRLSASAWYAADKYVHEREGKRADSFDIQKHERYNDRYAGVLNFAGLRTVDGHQLALLRHDDTVLVLPVDAATANRLRRLAIGAAISTEVGGKIRTRGRSL